MLKEESIKRIAFLKLILATDSDVTLIREGLLEFTKQQVSRVTDRLILDILLVKKFQ